MIRARTALGGCSFLPLLAALLLPGCATPVSAPPVRSIALGRNTLGEMCIATRADDDAAAPDDFDQTLYITCRSASVGRPLGAVRIVAATEERMRPLDAAFDCGAPAPMTIAGVAGQGARCRDRALGLTVIRFDARVGNRRLVADAAPAMVGGMEEAVAVVLRRPGAGRDATKALKPTVDFAALAAPAGDVAEAESGAFDPRAALAQGIGYSRRGLQVDASRVLNDALSRLPADADPALRAELQLEAGLADSNIRFGNSAQEHFAAADAIIAAPGAQTPLVRRKQDAYRALDLLNRRRFREALAALDALATGGVSADQPLLDPATLRVLNQSARVRGAASAVAVPDVAELSQVVLDAQTNWARSVALLAIGDTAAAGVALDRASRSFESLRAERIEQAPLLWLGARIERQRGRMAAQRGEWSTALASFDLALEYLRRGAIASAGTGTEPAIAETQLERASIFARSGASAAAVRAQYAEAVDALIAANATGGSAPAGLDGYLDLLIADAKGATPDDAEERFFRAIQATGEPAVARQLSQLRNVVSADPAIAGKVRERTELEREITRLRYAITAAPQTPGADAKALEAQRATAETRMFALDADLERNARYQSIDDRPTTIAELRRVLRPGEAFFKLVEINQRTYGTLVTGDRAFIYRVSGTPAETAALAKLGARIRDSIDGRQVTDGKLIPYRADESYALFRLLAGPSAEAMLAAKALVVDPAGPLSTLPIGVLVTARRPATPDPFDFSQTAFLAARVPISTAVSPRSFLVARAAAESAAAKPFVGLGEHQAPARAADTGRMISVGFGCSVPYAKLAAESRDFPPINKRELAIAADALGDPGAPMITDAAFNDTAIEARTDLADYQVLHFATHGLMEGQWGCPKSPPALVTSFGDADSDGLLSFSEIARLRLDANLVVLSACDTASGVRDESLARASGQEEAGATLEGLVRAFLTANARAVMATYWQASAEEDAQVFTRTFYATARAGTIGGALQTAQKTLIAQPKFSHPFFWAPYFIVGDSTKTLLSGPAAQVAAHGAAQGSAR